MITQKDLQGHWQRDWIKAPGLEDHTTRVHWLQAGALYADIRVPLERPETPGVCLADAGPRALLALMAAEAFAGEISVADSVCTWHRAVNWHGTPQGIDAGRMHAEGGAMFETGVHADYVERWVQKGAGLTAQPVQGGGLQGVLVMDATRFLLVMGTPDAPATAPLIEALRAGHVPADCAAHFEQPCALGHWDGPRGVADLALNPFAEGSAVLLRTPDALTVQWPAFGGGTRIHAVTPNRGSAGSHRLPDGGASHPPDAASSAS